MANLGTPYRVTYQAKNNKTGLSGITAFVVKPDGTTVGSFALAEFAQATHKGFYFFDLLTAVADPEGQWTGVVSSSGEGPHKTGFRIDFVKAIDQTLVDDLIDAIDELKRNAVASAIGFVQDDDKAAIGLVLDETLIGATIQDEDSISGTVFDDENRLGTLNDNETLKGEVEQ